jgi:N-acyl homoserine lactone hydrolase
MGLLGLRRPAAEAGEGEDGEDEADEPDGDPHPRDDEEEDDPHDDKREPDTDHAQVVPGGSTCKTVLIRPHLVGDVQAFGGTFPVFAHTIEHPEGLVLVDTGMTGTHPLVEDDWHPRGYPERIPRDVVCVINTHLHFDHCGGNHLFAGVPIHVQARELADALSAGDYTVTEWVDFEGATYVEHDGEAEVLPGIRLLPTPGHTAGHQSVLVEGVAVIGGDVAYSFRELGAADTEGKRRVLELGLPTWLAHVERPHVPKRN